MKQIVLQSLTMRNFKGIRNFTLNANGDNAKVFGDNGTGKTTLFDGFIWSLFDKDSQNKTKFDIKTLDKKGVPAHHLEHEVEGVLLVDGKRRTFRKVYKEKYKKKRGNAHQDFDGHTTDYFIDGVPSSEGEYQAAVANLINEDIFKMLTNPSYFNEQLKMKEKRDLLFQICGDMTDAEIIATNMKLSKLPLIIGDNTIEQHKKIIKARMTDINKELQDLPIRINEANRSMPDVGETDEEFLADDIASLQKRIQDKSDELSRIQSGGEVAVKEKRQRELEGELIQLRNQLQSGTMEKITEQRRVVSKLHNEAAALERTIDEKAQRVRSNEAAIKRGVEERSRLREQYDRIKAEEFQHQHDENCPTCGQSLPAEQVETSHQKALAGFNLKKSERLESISTQGKAAKAICDKLEAENKELATEHDFLNNELFSKNTEVSSADAKLEALQAGMTDVSTDPTYTSKQREIDVVKSEILGLRSANLGALEAARMELSKLRSEVSMMQQQQAKFEQVKTLQVRIDELMQQEQVLANEFAKLEGELHQTEEFTRTKVALLENRINSKFKYARFKLFDVQVNGALNDVCETTFEGVPYSSGLNNAARINVGLDIINTLSQHYGVTAPIFVDNAEAVTQLIPTDGQQISLIVSEKDKQLRVENNDMKEAV